MVIEAVRCDRFRLLQVVGQELPVDGLFVRDRVAGEEIVEAPVEEVGPVEGLRDFPGHPIECRGDLLLVRRNRR